MESKKRKIRWGCFCVIAMFLLLLGLLFLPHFFRSEVVGTVTEKAVKRSSGVDVYLVFIEYDDKNIEVLENTDAFVEWKFDSSDIYAKIKPGKKYLFSVYGWRVQFLSWYRNIVEIKEK